MITEAPQFSQSTYYFSRMLSALGAMGIALQNYPAVDLVIRAMLKGSHISKALIHAISFSAGSLCGGVVNYWMNVELLDGFFKRMFSTDEYQYKRLQLTAWQQLQYFGGILIFIVTGILYGCMAFTFAMEGPLAMFSIVAGLFVAGIMTIQEVETWLSSYDKTDTEIEAELTQEQQWGKFIGQMIAIGNVIALSLLFTLSLSQALIALNVAIVPALIIGFTAAFTFGAFTEYYFYHFYLAQFCKDFVANFKQMMSASYAWLGIMCVSTNAFVNAALTYVGIELLVALLATASIALPPVAVITTLAVVSALFAGSASFILGIDFWGRQNKTVTQELPALIEERPVITERASFGFFKQHQVPHKNNDVLYLYNM